MDRMGRLSLRSEHDGEMRSTVENAEFLLMTQSAWTGFRRNPDGGPAMANDNEWDQERQEGLLAPSRASRRMSGRSP